MKSSTPITDLSFRTFRALKSVTPITDLDVDITNRVPVCSILRVDIRRSAFKASNCTPLSQIGLLNLQNEHPYHKLGCRYLKWVSEEGESNTPIANRSSRPEIEYPYRKFGCRHHKLGFRDLKSNTPIANRILETLNRAPLLQIEAFRSLETSYRAPLSRIGLSRPEIVHPYC